MYVCMYIQCRHIENENALNSKAIWRLFSIVVAIVAVAVAVAF